MSNRSKELPCQHNQFSKLGIIYFGLHHVLLTKWLFTSYLHLALNVACLLSTQEASYSLFLPYLVCVPHTHTHTRRVQLRFSCVKKNYFRKFHRTRAPRRTDTGEFRLCRRIRKIMFSISTFVCIVKLNIQYVLLLLLDFLLYYYGSELLLLTPLSECQLPCVVRVYVEIELRIMLSPTCKNSLLYVVCSRFVCGMST